MADAAARADVAAAWGVDSLPQRPGRDTAAHPRRGARRAARRALLVGGVDPGDLPDPHGGAGRHRRGGFRRQPRTAGLSAVTERADVVLPVAPVVEKAGTFLDWEGRERPFDEVAARHQRDARRAGAARRSPRRWASTWRCPTSRPRAARDRRARRVGRRPGRLSRLHRRPRRPPPARARRSWPPGRCCSTPGRLQDGEPFLAGTARAAHARLSAGDRGRGRCRRRRPADGQHRPRVGLGLPVVIAEMPDGVVWLPTNSAGCAVRSHLAARHRLGRPAHGRAWEVPHERTAAGAAVLASPVVKGFGTTRGGSSSSRPSSSSSSSSCMTLFAICAERRVVGRMQQRIGPNRVGPFGLLQCLADGIKLALKEDIIPKAADKAVFVLAPIVSATCGLPGVRGHPVRPRGLASSATARRCSSPTSRSPCSTSSPSPRVGIYGIVLAGWSTRLDLPAARRPALVGADDLLRGRDGPVVRRRLHLRRLDVDVGRSSRHRRHLAGTSILAAVLLSVRHLRRSRWSARPTARPSTCPRPRASWSAASTPSTPR